MANEGLHPAATAAGADKAAEVRRLFAGIARRYDLVNHLASASLDVGWRRRTASELGLGPGQWCLDCCCGTADLSLAVGARGASVIGVDFCRPMLLQARGKRLVDSRVSLLEGDALALPVASASMDAACIGFGLRNVSDPLAALRDMARVVRPGGRVAVLEFSQPPGRVAGALYALYSRRLLPLLGDVVSGRWGTYRYLPQTIGRWLSPADLVALMRHAGLAEVAVHALSMGVVTLHVGRVPADGA
jgi:demethylmenaquinone methyltransferase/2-methoxy-6-polyprenyl-1,4-benzoquinol methylase